MVYISMTQQYCVYTPNLFEITANVGEMVIGGLSRATTIEKDSNSSNF